MNAVYRLSSNSFKIIPATDNMNKPFESSHKMWFYFSLSGVAKHTTLTFTIENINGYSKLYREGYKPVYKNEHREWD
jgi:hypothetical protein